MAKIGNKDKDFWRGIAKWDVVVLAETWIKKKGWDKVRKRLPREFN